MNKMLLGAAICASMMTTTANAAAADDEIKAIREQIQTLMQRLDRLEQQNAAPTTSAEKNPTAKTSADAKPKPAEVASDWASRVTVKGDLRYRHEHTDDEAENDVRERDRLRARIGIEAKVNDRIQAGVEFSTTENGDPRGANQTLDGEFSRKLLYIDLGYIDWTIASGAHAIAGKMRVPYFRPGQSLFWDNDINPEGLAVTYASGPWFANAYGFWVDENVPVVGTTATAADTMLYGAQVGAKWPIGASSLTLAAMYQDLSEGQGRRPFFNNSANGNTLIGTGNNAVLAFDFRVLELSAEFNTKLGSLPLQLWGDYSHNQDAKLDTAYTLGTLFGKANAPGTWEAGFAYERVEKDALFAQLIDSDFAGGLSDADGWIFRGGYAPMKNWVINATYFLSRHNIDVGTPLDFKRLLVDFNVKF